MHVRAGDSSRCALAPPPPLQAAANDNLARLVRGGSAQYAYEAAAGERLHCSPGSSAATCSVEVL